MTLSLVTGGAGFVGRHLVRALKARGESVRALDLVAAADVETIIGSIDDSAIAAKAVTGADTVFHLAGNAQLWAKDRSAFERVNHLGTRVMLEAAVKAGVRRFIHCSSLTTLIGEKTPIGTSNADEGILLSPDEMLGPYPRSKRLAEIAVEEAVRRGIDAVIAIPTEPLGPGDESLTPPTRMILDLLDG
ncbi:MAG: NAD-dependent epimerase/dehydratase family protein, partial [Pseudomonadota bacterium]